MALDLPEGWIQVTLAEVSERIVDGSHTPPPKQSDGLPMISARNVANGSISFDEIRLISKEEFDREDKRTRIRPNDVLLTIVGAVGRSAVVPPDSRPFTAQRSVAVISPSAVLPDFLSFQFRGPSMQEVFEDEARGTAQAGIYLRTLAKVPVLVPPLAEQKRIVAKVEELLARVDAGRERLDRVPKIMKRFRQAVLAAACSGRLTEGWREGHPGVETGGQLLQRIDTNRSSRSPAESKKVVLVDNLELPETPETWQWATVAQLAIKVTDGVHKTPKYVQSGIPFVSVNNFSVNGILSFEGCRHIAASEHELLCKRCDPQRGDVLLSKVGTIGMTAVVDSEQPFSLYVNTALIRPVRGFVEERFLASALRVGFTMGLYESHVGGSSQQFIGTTSIGLLPVPLPPLEEQREIVRRVEALFKLADAIERRVAAARLRTDKLTQSILAKAFRGDLVPTEAELARREGRSYEPASVLLERIRAERERGKPRAKKRRLRG